MRLGLFQRARRMGGGPSGPVLPSVADIHYYDFTDPSTLTLTGSDVDSVAAVQSPGTGNVMNASTNKFTASANGITSPDVSTSGLRLNETDTYWGPLYKTGGYIALVFRRLKAGQNEGIFCNTNSNNFQNGFALSANATDILSWRLSNGSGTAMVLESTSLGTSTDFLFTRLSWSAAAATYSVLFDSVEQAGAVVGAYVSGGSLGSPYLGILGNNISQPGDIEAAGLLIVRGPVSDTDRDALDDFMRAKYAALLP